MWKGLMSTSDPHSGSLNLRALWQPRQKRKTERDEYYEPRCLVRESESVSQKTQIPPK